MTTFTQLAEVDSHSSPIAEGVRDKPPRGFYPIRAFHFIFYNEDGTRHRQA
jgi:hypothetical protein